MVLIRGHRWLTTFFCFAAAACLNIELVTILIDLEFLPNCGDSWSETTLVNGYYDCEWRHGPVLAVPRTCNNDRILFCGLCTSRSPASRIASRWRCGWRGFHSTNHQLTAQPSLRLTVIVVLPRSVSATNVPVQLLLLQPLRVSIHLLRTKRPGWEGACLKRPSEAAVASRAQGENYKSHAALRGRGTAGFKGSVRAGDNAAGWLGGFFTAIYVRILMSVVEKKKEKKKEKERRNDRVRHEKSEKNKSSSPSCVIEGIVDCQPSPLSHIMHDVWLNDAWCVIEWWGGPTCWAWGGDCYCFVCDHRLLHRRWWGGKWSDYKEGCIVSAPEPYLPQGALIHTWGPLISRIRCHMYSTSAAVL